MKLKNGYILHKMENGAVIIDITNKNRDIIKLNDTGYYIVSKLSDDIDVKKLVFLTTQKYEISAEIAERDINSLLLKLKDIGVID